MKTVHNLERLFSRYFVLKNQYKKVKTETNPSSRLSFSRPISLPLLESLLHNPHHVSMRPSWAVALWLIGSEAGPHFVPFYSVSSPLSFPRLIFIFATALCSYNNIKGASKNGAEVSCAAKMSFLAHLPVFLLLLLSASVAAATASGNATTALEHPHE
jgi:hypothetical protein